jgi:hypothetical protein
MEKYENEMRRQEGAKYFFDKTVCAIYSVA